jgi:hypothetical protein
MALLQSHKLKISVAVHLFKGFSHCHVAIPKSRRSSLCDHFHIENALRIFEATPYKVIIYLFSSFSLEIEIESTIMVVF